MALNAYRLIADALTASRVVAGLALVARPSITLVAFGIATDWIDGAIARRGAAAQYGPRFDLEADSVLTLGAAIAAARRGGGWFLLFAPLVRYVVVAARDPQTYTAKEVFWDRASGIAQMAVLVAALSPRPPGALSFVAGPVIAARCAALAALVSTRAPTPTSTAGLARMASDDPPRRERYTPSLSSDRRRPAWSISPGAGAPKREDR